MSFEEIPIELREFRQWVGWNSEERDGKRTKIPVRPDGTANASTTDPATWGTFAEAVETARTGGVHGIGYVFTKDDPYVGVDLDNCIDDAGWLNSDARSIISALNSYTEASVSGHGVHVIVSAHLNGSRNRTTNTGWGGDFECYGHSRYFCVTGDPLPGTPTTVEHRQAELDAVLARIFPTPVADDSRPRLAVALPVELDDEDLFARARAARNGGDFDRLYRGDTSGYDSHSEADFALCGRLAFWAGPDPARIDALFRRSGLMRPKWDTGRGESTYGQQTIERALEGRTDYYSGGSSQRERPTTSDGTDATLRDPIADHPVHLTRATTDLGNAELFAERHAHHLRHVKERRQWLVWRDGRWRQDLTGEAERAAKQIARERLIAAADLSGDDQKKAVSWAMTSQSEPRIRALLALASTESEVVLRSDNLDVDPYLLACGNGVVDLRDGTLRAPDPADLISLGTEVNYIPEAPCSRWHRFLGEVFDDDQELVGFVRRAAGYSLTGVTREHAFFVLHGGGCNGKTTFVETIKNVAGDFAATSAFDTFTRMRGDRGVRNDLARLHRARLVIASESGEGRRLDEAVVKTLTGDDTVTTRFLYGEHFEYRPGFKLWLITNHRPRVDGDDDAIWRRIRLVPFEVSFQGREEKGLTETLQRELPGILAWAVQGCLEWQEDGLGLPPAVEKATAEYRQAEDLLGAFLDERCVLDRAANVEASVLREALETFCKELGERPIQASDLGRRLRQRGIEPRKSSGRRHYDGVDLTGTDGTDGTPL